MNASRFPTVGQALGVVCVAWCAQLAVAASPGQVAATASPAAGLHGDLIYTSLRTGSSQIFRIDADGARETRLTQSQHSELQPVWSRQGRIAFVSTRSGGGDIYTMDAQGGDLRQLTSRPGLEQSVAWSADGQHLAYIGETDGRAELRLVKADGTGDRLIAADMAEVGSPAWSPDGTKIAFNANVNGKLRVFVADLIAGAVTPAAEGKGGEFGPVWSPDGRSLVFVHSGSRTEGVNLRKVQLGSQTSVALTKDGYTNSQPRFSPDGSKLLFLSNATSQGSTMNVHVMNADGTGVVNLTRWEHADMGASWSADGQHVYFMSFRDWPGQIYRIGADGQGLQRLTKSASQEGFPVGRPAATTVAAAARNP